MARRIELVSGLAATVLGLAFLAYVLFGPTYASESTSIGSTSIGVGADGTTPRTTTRESESLLEQGVHPVTWIFLGIVMLTVLSAGGGAIAHGLSGLRAGLIVLWLSAVLLLVGAILSIFSVGLYVLPVALLALTAAIAASIYEADELRR